MKKTSLAALFLLCAGLVFASSLAPEFSLPDVSGRPFSSREYQGRPAILFFWTTWCPFCHRELKNLDINKKQFKEEGIEVVLINAGERGYRVESFLKKLGIDMRVLLDEYAEIADAYGVFGIPTYILVDKDGEIVFRTSRFPSGSYKELLLKRR